MSFLKKKYLLSIFLSLLITPLVSSAQLKSSIKTLFLQLKEEIGKEDPYDTSKQSIIYYANGKCSKSNCDKCISGDVCQCPNGYAQDPDKEVTNEEKSCQYKRKKQWVFFILEFLFFFGIGHFYAHRVLYGLIKFIVFALIIICDWVIKTKVIKNYKSKKNFNVGMILAYIGYFAWQIFDLIFIGINKFNDGKGIKLTTLH